MAAAGNITPPWTSGVDEVELNAAVAAAIAAIGNATGSVAGLMPPASVTKLATLDDANYVRFTTIGSDKYIDVPAAPDPTSSGTKGVIYMSASSGRVTAQKGTSGNRTGLAPVPNSYDSIIATPITITGTGTAAVGVFPVLANQQYRIDGDLGFNCDAGVDLELYFSGIPTGAAVTYFGGTGAAVATANAGQASVSVDVSRLTGTSPLYVGGTGADELVSISAGITVGASGSFINLTAKKKNTGAAGNVTILPSILQLNVLAA